MPANNVQFYSTDPNEQASFAQQQALLNQRQAMAQALLQQGMSPLETQGRQVGNIGYRISPFEGLAKILQSAVGRQEMQQTTKDQANLQAQSYANLLRQFGGDQPNPINPNGLPAAAAVGWMQSDPKSYWETAGKRWTPNDTTVQAAQGGVDPQAANRQELVKRLTDPKVYGLGQAGFTPDEIKKAFYSEAAKAAEIDRKAGNQFSNPLTGENGFVPKLPDNANPVGQPAPNGAVPGVAPIPGALPIVARQAGAVKGAQEDASIITVTTPDGRQVPVRAGPAAGAGNAQVGLGGGGVPGVGSQAVPPAQPGALPQPVPPRQQLPQPAPQLPQAVPQQPKLGQSLTDKTTQTAAAETLAKLPAQVESVKQARSGLENALGYIAKSGPGVSKTVNALAMVQNLGIPLMSNDTNGYMTLKKYLENSASQAAAASGFTGSDARFEQFKAGMPNAESMTPQALKGAIQYVLSQHDAALARGQFVQNFVAQNQNDPNAGQKALQAWANSYTPKVFEFSRMDPQERIKFVKSLDKDGLAKFSQQYNAANQQGWVQ